MSTCTNWLRLRNLPPPPHSPYPPIFAHIRGRYWSAKIENINVKSKHDINITAIFFSLALLVPGNRSVHTWISVHCTYVRRLNTKSLMARSNI